MAGPAHRSVLVLGGAASGKSAYAESLLSKAPLLYIATGQAQDTEMSERIKRHRDRRGPRWITVEEPTELVESIYRHRSAFSGILVDCLTMWISNLMMADKDVSQATESLCAAVTVTTIPLVLVSNEVGMGLVPDTAIGRQFRDLQGHVNQRLATVCSQVTFVAAGLPLMLKDEK